MKKIFSFFAAMLVVFAANAKVWTVGPNHNEEADRADCNLYVTLDRLALAGDTILMADGTYDEPYSASIKNNVVIMAAEGATPLVQLKGYLDLKANAEVIGVKFQFVGDAGNGYGFYIRENTPKFLKLEGCEFFDYPKYCVTGSSSSAHCDSVLVNNCYFHDCANGPFYFPASSLADNVNLCDKLKVTNSTFANIDVVGWVSVIDLRNNNSSTAATSKLVVDHCTFYNCQGDYERMIQSYKSPDVQVTNCIMMNPVIEGKTEIYAVYVYGGSVHHNLNYQTKRQYVSGGSVTDTICRNPQFVNAAEGNLTLGEGSPALTAAEDGGALGDPRWVPAAAPAHTYTVAGSNADLFGTTWAPANTANDMTLQTDGTYKWEKAELTLAAGSIEFKVCQDHVWEPSYPAQNYVLNITEAGIYTITITFDPSNNSVNAVATKTGSAEVLPTVAMHGNFLGSWADTQNFTEADDKASASLKLTLAAGNYEFGMRIGGSGNWTANGTAFTRQNNSAEVVSGQGNLTLAADAAGEYTFTWTYATNNLAITFPEAAQVVKFYVAGSMTSWNDNKIPVYEDSYTFENMAAGKYQMKVIAGAEWKGIDAMTDVAGGLYKDEDGNICFILDEAGNVTVNYTEEAFTMTGNFVAPEMKLIGINGWEEATDAIAMTAAEDKKSTSVKLNLTGEWYDFKVIRDGEWLGKANEGSENYKIWADYNWVDGLVRDYEGLKNVSLQPNGAGEYTFTYDYAAGKLTVTFPTPAPTGITWELNGGMAYPKSAQSKYNLWCIFEGEYNAYYNLNRAHQEPETAQKVATFANAKMMEIMQDANAGWKWLGDYCLGVAEAQNQTMSSESEWRWGMGAFWSNTAQNVVTNIDFTEAGKDENWLPACQSIALPASVEAEFTLPAAYKEGVEFGGWYDNAEFSGEALTFIPANYAGTLYAKWNSPATNIENTAVDAKVVKLIENGKLIIIRNGVRYNAQGQME